jgi:hypothetical protein
MAFMAGGPQIQDDFARVIVEEGLKTRKAAEKMGLAGASTQAALDKIMTFIRNTVEAEAAQHNKDGANPERNPAITALQRARDGVSGSESPQQIKTVDEYIKRLSQEYRKEINRVKAKELGEQLSQYYSPEAGESQGRQLTSIPAIVSSQQTEL